MGASPKAEMTMKRIENLVPVMRGCDLVMSGMRFAKQLVVNLINTGKELDYEWMSNELRMHMISLASTEDFYDCLPGDIEFYYPPSISGGHNYNLNLKGHTVSEFDVIQCSIGMKFKSYYCNLIHTIPIDPSETVKENMRFIEKVYKKVLESLQDGVQLSKVYEGAMYFAKQENNNLAEYLEEDLGYNFNPNFNLCVINSHTKAVAQEDMIFVINISLVALEEQGTSYNLRFSDTVAVKKNQPADVLTSLNRGRWNIK